MKTTGFIILFFVFLSLVGAMNITREDAEKAIIDSERIIQEMFISNLSILYVNDTLFLAQQTFEQAKFANILRNDSSAESERRDAQKYLALINWKEVDYDDVIPFTEDIKNRKEKAFYLNDLLFIEERKINVDISQETQQIFLNAKLAFREDRYDESEKLILDFQKALEKELSQNSVFFGVRSGARNFFEKYWLYLILLFVVFICASYFFYRHFERIFLKNKIKKMIIEREVLQGLMKKCQTERFKEGRISALVYNIRMKKYGERLEEIKQILPVLEMRMDVLAKKFLEKYIK